MTYTGRFERKGGWKFELETKSSALIGAIVLHRR